MTGRDGEPAPTSTPAGCMEEDSALGPYHANGVLDEEEVPIEGVRVELRAGECANISPTGFKNEVITTATDVPYTFTGVPAGTNCVSIDPQEINDTPNHHRTTRRTYISECYNPYDV